MIERTVFIDIIGDEMRRVVVENGKPVEYAVSYTDHESIVGNIYLARVQNILKGMNAAFVDLGMQKNAFLSMNDIPGAAQDFVSKSDITHIKTIKNGQEVIVQIVKEPGGDKGPKVTMNPTLPGNYVVLLPTIPTVGVSRHIADIGIRANLQAVGLQKCPQGMGLIMRTASENAAIEDISAEIDLLVARWHSLAASAQTKRAPVLLFQDADLVGDTRRDLQIEPVIGAFNESLEAQLDRLLRRKVWLDCGGFLIIDKCEAMVVIDVNSGKFTGKRNLNETIYTLNAEAATEIARQIRLRDMGGIIVIDFVDMKTDEDRQSVLDVFRAEMSVDRAKYHIHGFTSTGLLELTRRPLVKPVMEKMTETCPSCHDDGMVINANARAHALLREIRRKRLAGDESIITRKVSSDVAVRLRAIGLPDNIMLQEDKGGTP